MNLFDRVFESRDDPEATRQRLLRLYHHPKTSPEEREAAARAHERMFGGRPGEAPEEPKRPTGASDSFMEKFQRMVREREMKTRARMAKFNQEHPPGSPGREDALKKFFD